MDPKSIANLDPKLRETYERVMGATSGPVGTTPGAPNPAAPAPATPPSPTTPSPASATLPPANAGAPVSPPADMAAPVSPTPELSPVIPNEPPQSPLTAPPTAAFNSSTFGLPSGAPANQPDMTPLTPPSAAVQATSTGSSSLVKILYIFGGIIFFIVYIFFWIKIFNYQLPF